MHLEFLHVDVFEKWRQCCVSQDLVIKHVDNLLQADAVGACEGRVTGLCVRTADGSTAQVSTQTQSVVCCSCLVRAGCCCTIAPACKAWLAAASAHVRPQPAEPCAPPASEVPPASGALTLTLKPTDDSPLELFLLYCPGDLQHPTTRVRHVKKGVSE